MQEQWETCSAAIAARMPEQAYKTWIKPLAFLEFNADECLIRLGASTQIKADIVRNQYQGLIQDVLRDVIDPAMRVDIGVAPRAATAGQPVTRTPTRSADRHDQAPSQHQPTAHADTPSPIPAASRQPRAPAERHAAPVHHPSPHMTDDNALPSSAKPTAHAPFADADGDPQPALPDDGDDYQGDGSGEDLAFADSSATPARSFGGLGGQMPNERSRLNPGLTFAAFVNGKANDLARAAALQVADRPGSAYNPLFIHGGVGLGKTHLMQAVGNAIQQRENRATIRYISSNQFVQDLIQAIRRNAIDRFKHYYQSLDVLLIDDIQFLSDKQRSQEEFFHVFETMTINQRQIVITCDTYPKELKGIDDRLISRLNSGLIVAIEPPELEMRVAILQRKAEQARVRLPDDVAYFIAKNIRRNVRELEGALQRAIHYSSFRSSPLTLELAKESLKDLISFNRGQISIDFIQKTVAEYYKIKQADMYSKRRPAKIALPRQIAMYLAKELTQKSLPEIGDAFGGKDHTTVMYAVRKITELRAHDEDLNKQIHVLDQTLREYL